MEQRIFALLARPGIDPEARAELLSISASYLRSGDPMPEALRIHLAQAFEATAQAENSQKPKIIAEALGLVGEANRPRKISPIDVVKASAKDQTRLASRLMEEHGISERTARQRIAEVKEAHERLEQMKDANGLSGLIRKR